MISIYDDLNKKIAELFPETADFLLVKKFIGMPEANIHQHHGSIFIQYLTLKHFRDEILAYVKEWENK